MLLPSQLSPHAVSLATTSSPQTCTDGWAFACFTQWFTYRYLLFKPDRAELKAQITKLTDSILG